MSEKNSKIFGFIDRIFDLCNKFEKISGNWPEIICLIIYPLLFFFFAYFHEPWFDEAQAWQIAKCASYHDIVFYLPHFEGHPPFWHLILSVFAKNNFPYEITLRIICFIFSYIAAIIIIFKSPFYRIIKILLPFTYFLFYQNAIISRPYCIIMLAFCLIAIFWKNKYKKPYRYAFSLILLALTHPYSFVLSSFLALVWFIEGIRTKQYKSFKFYITCIILSLVYLSILCIIFPSPDADAVNIKYINNIVKRLIYTFLIIPSDCLISYICDSLEMQNFNILEMILGSVTGCVFWYFLYFYTKNKKYLFQTFLIPYIPFALCAQKYFSLQHLGVIFPFIVFIFWLVFEKTDKSEEIENNQTILIKKSFVLFITICLCVNLWWSFKSCMLDIFIRYSPGKSEAQFIKEHNLDKYKVMMDWECTENAINTNLIGAAILIAPYFEKNISYNLNDLYPEKVYVIHKKVSKEEVKQAYSRWKKKGYPDVIIENAPIHSVFNDIGSKREYITVYTNKYSYISKGVLLFNRTINIQVEKNLAQKLNLKKVSSDIIEYNLDMEHIFAHILFKLFVFLDEKGKQ